MLFRQLFDSTSSTYTYLLADEETRRAVLIDPVLEHVDRDLRLLDELSLTLAYVLETHVHADHVTGAGMLRERTGCKVAASALGAACVDVPVRHGDTLKVDALVFAVLATPGHTDDSVSYLIGHRVFTGDALLIRSAGRTDFQNGDPAELHRSITGVLFTLPDDTEIYPAHDYKGFTVSTIGEERRHNPRLAGQTEASFIQLMNGLNLPPPKQLDVAVPANRACGQRYIHQVKPAELGGLPADIRLVDVREPTEFNGPLGHLSRAESVPIGTLVEHAVGWNRRQPVLLICRSGARSLRAAQLLHQLGFSQLFNLEGGMLSVRS